MSEGRSIVACWATWALPAKVTMPTSMLLGQLVQEALCRFLRRHHARRLDVLHAHAQRHVDRQHDRGPCPGQRHRRGRTRQAQQQEAQCQQEECRRNVPSPLATRRPASDARRCQTQRRFAPSTQQPQVQRRQQGQRQHHPQVLGPQEVHLRRCAQHNSADPRRRQCTHGLGRTSIEHGFWRKRSAMSHANERFLSPRAFRLGRHHGVDPRTRPNRFSVRLNACGLRTTAAR